MRRVAGVVALATTLLVACDDGGSSAGTTAAPEVTICQPDVTAQAEAELPAVDLIEPALRAVQDEVGGDIEFFEINAMPHAVNVFVALNGATVAQQYVYVDGVLSAGQGQSASGGTFTADQLAFDPTTVFSTIRGQLPETILQTFYVNGDGQGNVKYAVLAVAQCGGALDIVVGPDGEIISVDPL